MATKLKMPQIEQVLLALNSLNWYPRKAKINGVEEDVKQPYLFGTECTLAILANRKALRKIIENFNETKNDLIKQISQSDRIEGEEQLAQFTPAFQKLIDEEHEIEFKKVKMTDLNPGPVNPIGADVLDTLEPLLE